MRLCALPLKDGAWLLERYPSVLADAAEAAGMTQIASTIRNLPSDIPLRSETSDLNTLVAGASEAAALAAANIGSISSSAQQIVRTGVRPMLRGNPPPPPEPVTPQEIQEMRTLAQSIVDSTSQSLDALTAIREKLAGLLAAQAKESQDEQEVWSKLVKRINEHKEYFNQAVWLVALTPRVVHLLLKDRIYVGELLNDVIDPTPVAITGNMVGFALASGKFLAAAGPAPDIDLAHVVTSEVALPTGGMFAEAVLGQAVSAERIDLTRFWNWQESPIPLTPSELKPVDLAHAPGMIPLDSGKLNASAAPLPPVTALPDPSGLAALLSTLREGNMFRDMSGLEAAKEVALAAAAHAASGAQDAAKNATQSFKDFAEFAEKIIPMTMTDGASSLLGGLANNEDAAAPQAAADEAQPEDPAPQAALDGASPDDPAP